jgi:GDPmannose 4,6-dehydratase
MQWMMLQQEKPKDYVIATGKQISVRDFLRMSSKELGLTLRFEGEGIDEIGIVDKKSGDHAPFIKPGDIIIKIDSRYYRPAEVEALLGDASKAKKELGWVPEVKVEELCHEMISYDLDKARQLALLKNSGYQVNSAGSE